MIPKLVVIQAKNVRSLAKWSLIFFELFFSIICFITNLFETSYDAYE